VSSFGTYTSIFFGNLKYPNAYIRVLLEYWNEGGVIQWIAQTCPELGSISRGIENAISEGAKVCFIHGGQMDFLLEQIANC